MTLCLVHLKGMWKETVDFLPRLSVKKIRKCSYPSGNKDLDQRRAGQEVWLGRRTGGVVGEGGGIGRRVSPAWELWFCDVSLGLGGLSRCNLCCCHYQIYFWPSLLPSGGLCNRSRHSSFLRDLPSWHIQMKKLQRGIKDWWQTPRCHSL